MGRCSECRTETERTFVWKDVFSCSPKCDEELDAKLKMASAQPAPPEIAGGILLTPRLEDGERLRMLVSHEDYTKLRRGDLAHDNGVGRHFGRITDLMTHQRYELYGAACAGSRVDGGCWCDALVKPVEVLDA